MKSTREKILRTLLAYPGSTIKNLADSVGINGISIRHHLTALEAEALVTSSEERHGVGRPRLIYSLTDKGVEKFPTSYLQLTRRILESLKTKMSPTQINGLFKEIGSDIAKIYENELIEKSLEERIKLLKTVMTREGFIVELKKNEDSYTLICLSCPYYQIGFEHPDICTLDHTLISTFLSVPVKIETCIFTDCDRCTYQIPIELEND